MRRTMRSDRILALVVLIGFLPAFVGCGGGYALRGKVVESSTSAVTVTDRNDPQLDAQGIGDVNIRIYRDPGRLSQELAGAGTSRADGTFDIRLNAFGAGWMDEEWLIETYRSGYSNAEAVLRLPTNTNRLPLLIMMRRGDAAPLREREDLLKEMERYR